jgi:hypothetical protein
MTEPAYYRLSEVEELFRISRDTLIRWARAGIFDLQGENRGRRATGVSVRAALGRLEAGEDLWQVVKESEQRAVSRTARAQSTRTKQANGGTSHPHSTASDSPEFEPLASKPPSWLKTSI